MNTRWKKAVSVGLCASLALAGLSGCSKKDSFDAAATAITVNDDTVSAGLLKFATHYMQSQYETMYANFGYTGIINQDIFGTGSTLGESIKTSMVEEMTHLLLAEQHMEEYGVTLSEEQKAAASEAAVAFIEANDEEVLELMAAEQETVARYLELMAVQGMMEEAMVQDVDTEVSDEEAAQRKIQYTLFTVAAETEDEEASTEDVTEEAAETEAQTSGEDMPETAALTENDTALTQSAAETEAETAADGAQEAAAETEEAEEAASEEETETETEDEETREARAKALAKAEDLLERLKAGEDFETASAEVDPDAYCGTTTFGADDDYRAELIEATDGLEDGTLVETPVETDTGYYVVRLETQVDREATDAEKETIVSERQSERISELYEEWEEEAEVSSDNDVLDEIVFAFSLSIETEAQTEAVTEAALSDAEAETSTETETETAAEAAAETEAETAAGTSVETESETVAEAAVETEAETAAEAAAETETETAAEAAVETETETDAETESVTASEAETESEE